jgi:hypothetical protein
MRLNRLLPAAFTLLIAMPAVAQDWIDYDNREHFFHVNFPSQPKVQTSTWTSEYGARLPEHTFRAEARGRQYIITVVDYTNLERVHAARVKDCPPEVHTGCTGSESSGVGSWRVDLRGAPLYAARTFLQRDAKITFFGWSFVDLVEGIQIQLTNNADQSRTFVGIYMHEDRLYILEATVPRGAPEPGQFQQSLQFLDKAGEAIRYQTIYSNGYPRPPRLR